MHTSQLVAFVTNTRTRLFSTTKVNKCSIGAFKDRLVRFQARNHSLLAALRGHLCKVCKVSMVFYSSQLLRVGNYILTMPFVRMSELSCNSPAEVSCAAVVTATYFHSCGFSIHVSAPELALLRSLSWGVTHSLRGCEARHVFCFFFLYLTRPFY